MHCDLELWHPKSTWYILYSWGGFCITFHGDRWKGKVIMRHKPFSVINASWSWPSDRKINRHILDSNDSLGVCKKFHDDRCKRKASLRQNHSIHFWLSLHCDLDLWNRKSLGHILHSSVFMWSFMMIGVKGKQLSNRTILPNQASTDERTEWFQYYV